MARASSLKFLQYNACWHSCFLFVMYWSELKEIFNVSAKALAWSFYLPLKPGLPWFSYRFYCVLLYDCDLSRPEKRTNHLCSLQKNCASFAFVISSSFYFIHKQIHTKVPTNFCSSVWFAWDDHPDTQKRKSELLFMSFSFIKKHFIKLYMKNIHPASLEKCLISKSIRQVDSTNEGNKKGTCRTSLNKNNVSIYETLSPRWESFLLFISKPAIISAFTILK